MPPSRTEYVVRRILVVDDELNLALLLYEVLQHLPDCEIEIATSGEDALRLFAQQSFDLLITDYKMPGMDGILLTRRVLEEYPGTAVVIITAYADEIPDKAEVLASVEQILDKPVRIKTIRAAACEALAGEPTADCVAPR